MPLRHPQFRRVATLSGLVAVSFGIAVAFLPGAAVADTGYSCSNGTLYANGVSTGGSSTMTSLGLVWCEGNRVHMSARFPTN